MTAEPRRWDIFCKVVDHFGDAGVSWRLARHLAARQDLDVTLWIDGMPALASIAPGLAAELASQRVAGVTVRRLEEPLAALDAADVVIDAFGGGLPNNYLAAMVDRSPAPLWIVLEYLSAESWVEASHGLASPHPRLPLVRRFFFPGFAPATGGLLRERDLFLRRDAFRADPQARASLWSALGVPGPAAGETRISLFCYPNPRLAELLDAWADGDEPIVCLVPEGVATGQIDAWAAGSVPHARGAPLVRGRLALHAIPFVDQDAYDRLLWACDVNFVRGEDSFVRAQWAARPLAWHIYVQGEDAHQPKLEAFVDRYTAGLPEREAEAVRRFQRAWNGDAAAGPIAAAWLDFAARRSQLNAHAERWAAHLARVPDLASQLVKMAVSGV